MPSHADASQIRILFDELIRNAIEAISEVPNPSLVVNCQAHPADALSTARLVVSPAGAIYDRVMLHARLTARCHSFCTIR